MKIEADPVVRVRLDLSYDGTDFSGWATQPGQRTVQGELEAALATVLRTDAIALTVAGRTDAGVHATGQVAHFDLASSVWVEQGDKIVRRLAGVLPLDIRVRTARIVPDAFDARFAALWRAYEYLIDDAPGGPEPLVRHHVLSWRRRLDADAMAGAASGLVGLHDYAAFCKRREGATTIRTVLDLTVERAGDLIACRVRADAFCHSMVRSLVGALIAVGERRRAVEWPAALLARSSRADEVPVAPAHGLRLVAVGYPADDELAARAEQTRAVRTLPVIERAGGESGDAEA